MSKIYTVEDLLADEGLFQQQYWLYPFLPKTGTAFLGAPPKHYKTIFAMQMSFALATGLPFLGYTPQEQARVLYVDQEVGGAEMKNRARMLSQHFDTDLEGRLGIVPLGDKRYSLDRGSSGRKMLLDSLEEFSPDVLVLDPFRKTTGADENSSTEMTKVFESLTEIQKTRPEGKPLAVILVHHSHKKEKDQDPNAKGDPENLRGSSEIFAHGDSYGIFYRPISHHEEQVNVEWTMRHHPKLLQKLTFERGMFVDRVQKTVVESKQKVAASNIVKPRIIRKEVLQ